jgi:hypothetical protein
MTEETGKLQDPLSFAVEIRSPDHKRVWGTGFVVAPSGLVVTCRHVVAREPNSLTVGTEVGVYFRGRADRATRTWQARVRTIPETKDDIILLQLSGEIHLVEQEIAILGRAEASQGNRFRSFGFPELHVEDSSWADGTVVGSIVPREEIPLLGRPVQLSSSNIHPGMSGAPVLDIERNLVVAVLERVWIPGQDGIGRDMGWGVDAETLGQAPFGLSLREEPLPRRLARQPQPSLPLPPSTPLDYQRVSGLPALVEHWIDREELVAATGANLADSAVRIVGLIGFGGTGKSNLARKLVDISSRGPSPAVGVFWWSFNLQQSVDAFLEAALRFITEDLIDPRRLPSAGARVQVIAAGLGRARLLFVLDGLESVQSQAGDRQGQLENSDLRDLIELFAESSNQSCCLITSRLPVIDLVAHSTYRELVVGALTPEQGQDLLHELGVPGTAPELGHLVEAWGAHPLTLALLAGLLADTHAGAASPPDNLSLPALGESRYKQLKRLLEFYEAHLSNAERIFLAVVSLFRRPVALIGFQRVFGDSGGPVGALRVFRAVSSVPLDRLVEELVRKQLLQCDAGTRLYSLHPLIRSYFRDVIKSSADFESLHLSIARHYLADAKRPSDRPLLEHLSPWIEALHHRAQARHFDAALDILWQVLQQKQKYLLTSVLGAFDAMLEVLREFFAGGDLNADCLIPPSVNRRRVMREAGFIQMTLGHSRDAANLYQRLLLDPELETAAPKEASLTRQDLCRLKAVLGELTEAELIAETCVAKARDHHTVAHKRRLADARNAFILRGWIRQLKGNAAGASSDFKDAVKVGESMVAGKRPALDGFRGALYCEYLRFAGQSAQARTLALLNLAESERLHQLYNQSRFHRILGVLDADGGARTSAREHLDAAVRLARNTSDRLTLLQALLDHSRVLFEAGDQAGARTDLDEVLARSEESGFRLLAIDAGLVQARLHHAGGNLDAARREAEAARAASVAIGYAAGGAEATAVLAALDTVAGPAKP